MKITVLCTDHSHPVNQHLQDWRENMRAAGHQVSICHDMAELDEGDMLFLVSCSQLIRPAERERYRYALVLHASELPVGRGWSPHIWSIVNGANEITVCLLEANDPVDTGAIWLRKKFRLEGHELLAEINQKLFDVEMALMTQAVEGFAQIKPQVQTGDPGPRLPKRTPENSRLDPNKTIAEQFDLLRVVDPVRFPAFMDHRGQRYVIKIEKAFNHEEK